MSMQREVGFAGRPALDEDFRGSQMEVISILAENGSGVLTRIAGLFGRRGYSIHSLTVSETDVPGIARLTITIEGDKVLLDQVIHQISKLVEVRTVEMLDPTNLVQRELLLAKVDAPEAVRSRIREAAEIFKANIVDFSVDSMMVELTGKPGTIDAFLEILKPYGILEMCRTGVTALSRGRANVLPIYERKNG